MAEQEDQEGVPAKGGPVHSGVQDTSAEQRRNRAENLVDHGRRPFLAYDDGYVPAAAREMQIDPYWESARYDEIGDKAWARGNWQAALAAYEKAGSFDKIHRVRLQLTTRYLENKAHEHEAAGRFREAAWTYERLVSQYPAADRNDVWLAAQKLCWDKDLSPHFDAGQRAISNKEWVSAVAAFSEVVSVYPGYRRHNQSASYLLQEARDALNRQARAALQQGDLDGALNHYREAGNPDRLKRLEQIIHLRHNLRDEGRARERTGDWGQAVLVYERLQSLTISEDEEAAVARALQRCLTEKRRAILFDEASMAMDTKDWQTARERLGLLVRQLPAYERKGQSARALYRKAAMNHWLSTTSRLISFPLLAALAAVRALDNITASLSRTDAFVSTITWLPLAILSLVVAFVSLEKSLTGKYMWLGIASLLTWLLVSRYSKLIDGRWVGAVLGRLAQLSLVVVVIIFLFLPVPLNLLQSLAPLLEPLQTVPLLFSIANLSMLVLIAIAGWYAVRIWYALVGDIQQVLALLVALSLARGMSSYGPVIVLLTATVVIFGTIVKERAIQRRKMAAKDDPAWILSSFGLD